MEQSDKVEAFFSKSRPFKEELGTLRALAGKTGATETFKWNSPTYTINGKNVFGIMGFKNHFGIWFFNGVYMKDPMEVLETAQEKTKAMRHWKFRSAAEIKEPKVLEYMKEAILNQKNGLVHKTEVTKGVVIPTLLKEALNQDIGISLAFKALAPYKQREYCEYISSAKQEKTRLSRLAKSIALLKKGISLNEQYQ